MKILIINGPNLNMLGKRGALYGDMSYDELCQKISAHVGARATLEFFQSNHEGELIDKLHKTDAAAVVINGGGLSHTSVSLRDAVEATNLPAVEVHITNIYAREEYRRRSLISEVAKAVICGFGVGGYLHAVDFLLKRIK